MGTRGEAWSEEFFLLVFLVSFTQTLTLNARIEGENKYRLQRLFLVLTGFSRFVLAGFSPKSHSQHTFDFGDNICLFM